MTDNTDGFDPATADPANTAIHDQYQSVLNEMTDQARQLLDRGWNPIQLAVVTAQETEQRQCH